MSGLALTSLSALGADDGPARRADSRRCCRPRRSRLRTFPQNDEIALLRRGLRQRRQPAAQGRHHRRPSRSDEGHGAVQDTRKSAIRASCRARSGGYGYTARIPLTDLPPGPVRADASKRRSRLGDTRRRAARCSSRLRRRDRRRKVHRADGAGAPGPQCACTAERGHARCSITGRQSEIDEARQVVVRTAAEWNALWKQHAPQRPRAGGRFRARDGRGGGVSRQPAVGWLCRRDRAEPRPQAGTLVVQYRETTPPARRDRRAGDHVAVPPRRDAESGRRREVRKGP